MNTSVYSPKQQKIQDGHTQTGIYTRHCTVFTTFRCHFHSA